MTNMDIRQEREQLNNEILNIIYDAVEYHGLDKDYLKVMLENPKTKYKLINAVKDFIIIQLLNNEKYNSIIEDIQKELLIKLGFK